MPVTSVRELRVLQMCKHPNLVELKRVVTGEGQLVLGGTRRQSGCCSCHHAQQKSAMTGEAEADVKQPRCARMPVCAWPAPRLSSPALAGPKLDSVPPLPHETRLPARQRSLQPLTLPPTHPAGPKLDSVLFVLVLPHEALLPASH